MQDHYPIRLLEENATLPDQEAVLERFRRLVIDRPSASARPAPADAPLLSEPVTEEAPAEAFSEEDDSFTEEE